LTLFILSGQTSRSVLEAVLPPSSGGTVSQLERTNQNLFIAFSIPNKDGDRSNLRNGVGGFLLETMDTVDRVRYSSWL